MTDPYDKIATKIKGVFNSAYAPTLPQDEHYTNSAFAPPIDGNPVIKGGIDSFKGVYEDSINHPSHYTNGDIECIDAIESAVSSNPNPKEVVCQTNIIKYIWRYYSKDQPLKDLQKCRWYLDRLIKMKESE